MEEKCLQLLTKEAELPKDLKELSEYSKVVYCRKAINGRGDAWLTIFHADQMGIKTIEVEM